MSSTSSTINGMSSGIGTLISVATTAIKLANNSLARCFFT
ncbi:Uncharacterised protein [Vibrio cholerae]|nr:Uncharacterised protein [Vibrio cholerae]